MEQGVYTEPGLHVGPDNSMDHGTSADNGILMGPGILLNSGLPSEPGISLEPGLPLHHIISLNHQTDVFLISINGSSGGSLGRTDIVMLSLSVVIFVLSLGTNLLVFVVIGQTRSLQRINSVLQVSLAVADLCRTLFMPLFTLYLLKQMLPLNFCPVYHVFHTIFRVATALNLTAIGLERLFIITSPLKYQRLMTTRKMVVFLVLLWLISVLYGVLQILWFRQETKSTISNPISCDYKPSLGFAIFDVLMFFLGPLVGLFVCYCKIFCVVQSQLKRINPTISDWTIDRSETFQQEASQATYRFQLTQRQSDFHLNGRGGQIKTISIPEDMVMPISIVPTTESIARTLDAMGPPNIDSMAGLPVEEKDNKGDREEVQVTSVLPENGAEHQMSNTDLGTCVKDGKHLQTESARASSVDTSDKYTRDREICSVQSAKVSKESLHKPSPQVEYFLGGEKLTVLVHEKKMKTNMESQSNQDSQLKLTQKYGETVSQTDLNTCVAANKGNKETTGRTESTFTSDIAIENAENTVESNSTERKNTNAVFNTQFRQLGAPDNVSDEVPPTDKESPGKKHALPVFILDDLDIPASVLDRRVSKGSVATTEASSKTETDRPVTDGNKLMSKDSTKEYEGFGSNIENKLQLDSVPISKEIANSIPISMPFHKKRKSLEIPQDTKTQTAKTKAKIFTTTSSQQSSGYHSQTLALEETPMIQPYEMTRRPSALKGTRPTDGLERATSSRRRGSVSFKTDREEILPDPHSTRSSGSFQCQPIKTVLRDKGSGESEATTLETSLSSGRERPPSGAMEPSQRQTRLWARQHFNVRVSDSDTIATNPRPSLPSISMISTRSQRRLGSFKVTNNKALKMTLVVIGALVLTWLPYQITFIMRRTNQDLVSMLAWNITVLLHYASALINPLVYNFYAAEFRRALKRILFCRSKSDFPWS